VKKKVETDYNYTVYMHVNTNNEMIYVGITCQDLKLRWRKNGKGYKDNTYLKNAIDKYGWDNFEHIVLFKNKTKKEAEELESLFIKIFLSNDRDFGYNLSDGGKINKGWKHSDEAKQKISLHNKNNMAKKVICDNVIFDCLKDCAKYYDVVYGTFQSWIKNYNGMPQKFIDLGLRYVDDEYIDYKPQIGKATGENNSNSRKVMCDGKNFVSIRECAKYYNLRAGLIESWLKKVYKMPQKFIDLNLRFYGDNTTIYEPQIKHSKRKVICGNMIFKSIADCANYYDINYSKMYHWLFNKVPKKYAKLGLRIYNEEIDGCIEQYKFVA